MDEILASIRRMISDDAEPAAEAQTGTHGPRPHRRGSRFFPEVARVAGEPRADNVVELAIAQAMEDARIEVGAEAAIEAAVAVPSPVDAKPSPPLAETPSEATTVGQGPGERAPIAAATSGTGDAAPAAVALSVPPAAEPAREEDRSQPLLSPTADVAVAGAFNRLAGVMLSRSTRGIDELAEDLLRPLLRSWLDQNLPPMVERLVREEIERVSRGRR